MGSRIEVDDLPFRHFALGGIVVQTHKWHNVRFGNDEVKTLVTHDPTMVKSWITETLEKDKCRIPELIVSLDIEWSPEFIKGCNHSVAVLQLCVGKSCLVYQILHSGKVPRKLRSVLMNPRFTFVGVGIKNDMQKLWDDHHLGVLNKRDLGSWAAEELGMKELKGAGLKRLVEVVVGKEMRKSKSVACSRWDEYVLTDEQAAYACGDAYYSFEIGSRLNHLASGGRINQTHKWHKVKLQNEEVDTLVTHDPAMVESWITKTLAKNKSRLHRLIVGLDIEWSPKSVMRCNHTVALLQLCVGRSCLVYQIHRSDGIPQKLKWFLENYLFVGAWIKDDADKLQKDYGLSIPDMMDLSLWAEQQLEKEELRFARLKHLVKEVVGVEMDKPERVTCSRWGSHVLTEEQVAYACADAYYSFEVGRRLSAWY